MEQIHKRMLVTKQVRNLLSWSIPQQSVIHPGDRFTTCEFDQAAVKVGSWTNWTACWVNCSTSKRSLHITLFSLLYPISLFWATALFTCIQNQMGNKIASNKTEVPFPVKMIKIAALFLLWNLLPIILHLKVLISFYFFIVFFSLSFYQQNIGLLGLG